MAEYPRRMMPEGPSRETIERYLGVVSKMIEEKIVELRDTAALESIDQKDIVDAAGRIPMTPANDKMTDEDIRDLIGRGSDIENAAKELLGIPENTTE